MENSTIIGIIGIIATLVFGFLSIDLLKRKKYPGKITYVKLSLIDLLNNVANNFKEIKLLHDNSPIKKNIIYIKGALLNNGDIDINGQLTEKDISAKLPENCKWLDIKATEFSEDLSVDIKIEKGNKALFKFDLFRKGEFVQFEGLIEVAEDKISADNIESEIEFSHRIENTSKIKKRSLLTKKELKRKKRNTIIYSITLLVILIVLTLTTIFNVFGAKAESIYFTENDSPNKEIYQIKLKDSMVVLNPINADIEEFKITVNEFNEKYIASEKKLTFWQKFKMEYWVLSIYLGFFLIYIVSDLLEINKARRLSKILTK